MPHSLALGLSPNMGGSAWSPANLAPNIAIYSNVGVTGSAPVTAWTNGGTSGTTYNLTNSGAPDFQAAGGPNGQPRIHTTGTDRMVAGSSFPLGANSTTWHVCRVVSTTLQSATFQSDQFILFTDAAGAWHLFNAGSTDNTHTTATTVGAWQAIELTLTSTNGGTTVDFVWRVGGASMSIANQPYAGAGTKVVTMGGSAVGIVSNASANVDTAALVSVNRICTAAEKTLMRAWILATYGLTA